MTIRNLIVYRHFIPISLGAGQTLLEGIADYDKDNRFNIPKTDIGIANQEAEMLNRPDYAGSLFGKDGIERDRNRVKRALRVIKENPIWFASVMFRRALWMLQLERARTISAEIPVIGSLEKVEDKPLIWTNTPESLSRKGKLLSNEGAVHLENDNKFVTITGDKSKKGEQFATEIIKVNSYRENVLKINLQLQQGRTRILVKDSNSSNLYALTEVNTLEGTAPENQPIKEIKIPFVSRSENVQIVFVNENPPVLPSIFVVRGLEIYEISNSSAYWLRPLRILLGSAQKIFLTAVFLLLQIFGFYILLKAGKRKELLMIMMVPLYFLCIQSIFHTEFRYIIVIHHFLFILAAVAIMQVTIWLQNKFLKRNVKFLSH